MEWKKGTDKDGLLLSMNGLLVGCTSFGNDELPYLINKKGEFVDLHAHQGKPLKERMLILEALSALEHGE